MNGGVSDIPGDKAAHGYLTWLPDHVVKGRTIAVFSLDTEDCSTVVVSGRALVFTQAIGGTKKLGTSENCRRALAFTRATIDVIPR